jgi:cell division protein FtsL
VAFLGKSQEEVEREIREAVEAERYKNQQEITVLKRIIAAYEKKEADAKKINIPQERAKMAEAELTAKIAELKNTIENQSSKLDEAQDEIDELRERTEKAEYKAAELKNTLARYLARENGEKPAERYFVPFNLHFREQKDKAALIYDIHLPVSDGRANLISAAMLANEYQENREESGEFKLRRVDLWGANGEYVARFIERINPDFEEVEEEVDWF